MAKLRKNFTGGKQIVDIENKLLPPTTYRQAQNVSITRSESSNVGSVQSIYGNRDIEPSEFPIDPTNITIGQVIDSENDRIYWFFRGGNTEGIYEYDLVTNEVNRILEFTNTRRIFNFSVNSPITGVNVIGDLLYWTDNLNPPRKINIERFRGTAVDPTEDNSTPPIPLTNLETDLISGINIIPAFSGDLISVSKRPPLFSPKIVNPHSDNSYGTPGTPLYEQFVSFSYRYKYRDGEVTAMSPFTQPAFFPENFSLSRNSGIFSSMVNRYNSVDIKFDVGNEEVTEVELLLKESNSGNVYVLSTINKVDNQIISSTPYQRRFSTFTYDTTKVYRILPSDELTRIYDAVPIRAKAQEFVGNRLVYGNYIENYPLTKSSENGAPVVVDYDISILSEFKNESILSPSRTCKSDRYYEVGIVYLDREGRQTPVLVPTTLTNTSRSNSALVPFNRSARRNRLEVEIFNEAPYWATHYRFFIKQTKLPFYNVAPTDIIVDSANDLAYLRIPSLEDATTIDETNGVSSTINKINREDTILFKSRNVSSGRDSVAERREYRVTEVGFIDSDDITAITENGVYITITPVSTGDLSFLPTGEDATTAIFETVPIDTSLDLYYEFGQTYKCNNGLHSTSEEELIRTDHISQVRSVDGSITSVKLTLNWFNAFGYSNGVESMHVRDEFFGRAIEQGARASTISEEYRQRHQQSRVIHSGIYNDDVNLNRLNEFNVSQPISFELEIVDGSIQKLHQRNTNLIVFQEDKVKNVPINKNLITTAGGDNSYSISSAFFNTEQAYTGNYGISKSPESFATYGANIYWVDKNRGVACRLGANGITEISAYGLENLFRTESRSAELIIGGYDEYFKRYVVTLRNFGSTGDLPTSLTLNLGTTSCPDPRAECMRDVDTIHFEEVYLNIRNSDLTLSLGDVIFIDEGRETHFNGSFRFFRLREGTDADPTYNRVIQVSPDGIVTAIVDSCSTSYPSFDGHRLFNISSENFLDEYDACDNAVVDSIAYFGCRLGDDSLPTDCTLAAEPEVDNILYEGKNDLVPSSRTGWFLISESNNRFAINIESGEVIQKIPCSEIELGRRSLQGSEPIFVIAGESDFNRNVRLCASDFTEETYYWNGTKDRPVENDILYTSDILDTDAALASPSRFYAFEDGYFVLLDADSSVMSSGDCFTRLCDNDVNPLFTQSTDDGYTFTFNGIGDSNSDLQGGEIEWVILGVNRYPSSGVFIHTFSDILRSGSDITLSVPADSNILESNNDTEVRIIRVCYNQSSIAGGTRTIYRTANSGNVSSLCAAQVEEALFIEEGGSIYYTDSTLLLPFNGGGNQWGIAEEDNTEADRVITISAVGLVEQESFIYCSHPNLLRLSYTREFDNTLDTCTALSDTYYADSTAFGPATELVSPDGLKSLARNGFYSDRVIVRELRAGLLRTRLESGCDLSITSLILHYGADETEACHGDASRTVFTNNNTLDEDTNGIFTDSNLFSRAATGTYSNQVTQMVSFWDSDTGTLTEVVACPLLPLFEFDDAGVSGDVVADGTATIDSNVGSIISFTASADDFTALGNGGSFARVDNITDRAVLVTLSVPTGFRNSGSTVTGTFRVDQPLTVSFRLSDANISASIARDGTITASALVVPIESFSSTADDFTPNAGGTGGMFGRANVNTEREITISLTAPSGAWFNEGETVTGVITVNQLGSPTFSIALSAGIVGDIALNGVVTLTPSSGVISGFTSTNNDFNANDENTGGSFDRVGSNRNRTLSITMTVPSDESWFNGGEVITESFNLTQLASPVLLFDDAGVTCLVTREGAVTVVSAIGGGTFDSVRTVGIPDGETVFPLVPVDTDRNVAVDLTIPSGYFMEGEILEDICATSQEATPTLFFSDSGVTCSVTRLGVITINTSIDGASVTVDSPRTPNIQISGILPIVAVDTDVIVGIDLLVPIGWFNVGGTITGTCESTQDGTPPLLFADSGVTCSVTRAGVITIDSSIQGATVTIDVNRSPNINSDGTFPQVGIDTSRSIGIDLVVPAGYFNTGSIIEGVCSTTQTDTPSLVFSNAGVTCSVDSNGVITVDVSTTGATATVDNDRTPNVQNDGTFNQVSTDVSRTIGVDVVVPAGFFNSGDTIEGVCVSTQPNIPIFIFSEAGVTCFVSQSGTISVSSSLIGATATVDAARTTDIESDGTFLRVSVDTDRTVGVDVVVPSGYINSGDTIEGICESTQEDSSVFEFSDTGVACSVTIAGVISHDSTIGTTSLNIGQSTSYPRIGASQNRNIDIRVQGTIPSGFAGGGTAFDLTGICVASQESSPLLEFDDTGVTCAVSGIGAITHSSTIGTTSLGPNQVSSYDRVTDGTTRNIIITVAGTIPAGYVGAGTSFSINGTCTTTQDSSSTFTFADAVVTCSVTAAGAITHSSTTGTTSLTSGQVSSYSRIASPLDRTISITVSGTIPNGFVEQGEPFSIIGNCISRQVESPTFSFETANVSCSVSQSGAITVSASSHNGLTTTPPSYAVVSSSTVRDISVTVTIPSGFVGSGGTVVGNCRATQTAPAVQLPSFSLSTAGISFSVSQAGAVSLGITRGTLVGTSFTNGQQLGTVTSSTSRVLTGSVTIPGGYSNSGSITISGISSTQPASAVVLPTFQFSDWNGSVAIDRQNGNVSLTNENLGVGAVTSTASYGTVTSNTARSVGVSVTVPSSGYSNNSGIVSSTVSVTQLPVRTLTRGTSSFTWTHAQAIADVAMASSVAAAPTSGEWSVSSISSRWTAAVTNSTTVTITPSGTPDNAGHTGTLVLVHSQDSSVTVSIALTISAALPSFSIFASRGTVSLLGIGSRSGAVGSNVITVTTGPDANDYSFSTSDSWVNVSISGSSVTVTADRNERTSSRNSSILFSHRDDSSEFTRVSISQAGSDAL